MYYKVIFKRPDNTLINLILKFSTEYKLTKKLESMQDNLGEIFKIEELGTSSKKAISHLIKK